MPEGEHKSAPVPERVQNEEVYLPENSRKHSKTDSDYVVRTQRMQDIISARENRIPSIKEADSWTDCVEWSTMEKIKDWIKAFALKGDILSKKAFILSRGIQDRIRWNEEHQCWYGWIGNAWHPYAFCER